MYVRSCKCDISQCCGRGIYPDMLHIMDLQLCHDVISSCLLDLSDFSSPRDRRLQELSAEYEVWCAEQRDMAQIRSMGAEPWNQLFSTSVMHMDVLVFFQSYFHQISCLVLIVRTDVVWHKFGLQVSHLLLVRHENCSLRRSWLATVLTSIALFPKRYWRVSLPECLSTGWLHTCMASIKLHFILGAFALACTFMCFFLSTQLSQQVLVVNDTYWILGCRY